jgi:tetratricopeptide (TPR) repeat protein
VLRTGFGLRRSYSPRQVAQRLGVGVKQERRIERAAVIGLQGASAHGGCAGASQATRTIAQLVAGAPLAIIQPLLGPGSATPQGTAQATGSRQPRRPGPTKRGAARHAGSSAPGPGLNGATIDLPAHGGIDWLLVAAAIAALALIVAEVVRTRRSRAPAVALVGDGAEPRRDRKPIALALLLSLRAAQRRFSPRANGRAPALEPGPPPEAVAARTALHVGRTLEARQDLDGAEAAYRRGDRLDDAGAALALGVLLANRGDLNGAAAAFQRAENRGSADAASNLGVLLDQQGRLADAEAAYRRADRRGHPHAAFNLAGLLAQKGDIVGAEAAYRRAADRGDGEAAANLGMLLELRGDADGAEAAYRRADERGHAAGAFALGEVLARRGDHAGAEAAYRRADERGDAGAAFALASRYADRGDLEAAAAAYRRADARGADDAADRLGALLERRGGADQA